MRLFALQTDTSHIIQRFCHEGECVVHATHYHWMMFAIGIFHEVMASIGLGVLAVMALYLGMPPLWTALAFAGAWVAFCFFGVLKAFLDWYYDMIIVTTDKVILVDQSSIFRQSIKPIHLENIGAAGTVTQWWNLFPFGKLVLDLKEGDGGVTVTKPFTPNAAVVASAISDVLTQYQRGALTNPRERGQAQAEIGRRALRGAAGELPVAATAK